MAKSNGGKVKVAPSFVTKSVVKDFLSGKGFRSSGDVFDSLNNQIADILTQGVERCKANSRQTVKGSDI